MTKMTIFIGITAIVLVGAFLFAGFHARSSFAHGGGRFMGCMVDKIADKLDLTPAQRDQVDQIAEELRSRHKENRSLHMAAKAAMMEELRKPSMDREKIDELYQDTKRRFDDMYELAATRLVEFHRTLTPEQREKLVAEMEKHHERRKGYHHRWHGDS
jgi:protein CpxP